VLPGEDEVVEADSLRGWGSWASIDGAADHPDSAVKERHSGEGIHLEKRGKERPRRLGLGERKISAHPQNTLRKKKVIPGERSGEKKGGRRGGRLSREKGGWVL